MPSVEEHPGPGCGWPARRRALAAFDRGNVSDTARALGLHRQSLQKRLRRLGLSGDPERDGDV